MKSLTIVLAISGVASAAASVNNGSMSSYLRKNRQGGGGATDFVLTAPAGNSQVRAETNAVSMQAETNPGGNSQLRAEANAASMQAEVQSEMTDAADQRVAVVDVTESSENLIVTASVDSFIGSDKSEYNENDPVTVTFDLGHGSPADPEGYSIGIFMRMADPQDGTLDPLVSLPVDSARGAVTFSKDTMMDVSDGSPYETMTGSAWPMDLYDVGTGFDAYVLNPRGEGVVGPVAFNILMDD